MELTIGWLDKEPTGSWTPTFFLVAETALKFNFSHFDLFTFFSKTGCNIHNLLSFPEAKALDNYSQRSLRAVILTQTTWIHPVCLYPILPTLLRRESKMGKSEQAKTFSGQKKSQSRHIIPFSKDLLGYSLPLCKTVGVGPFTCLLLWVVSW